MIEEHAILAPSSSPQWGYCSGSVAANRSAPDVSSERARTGTASHWVGAECLLAGPGAMAAIAFIGEVAPNGVVIDEETAEGAQAWVNDVFNTSAEHGSLHGLMVEYRVTMGNIHPENWGTLDSAIWLPECNTLYIWDYKYGHREVDVRENLQLINYVAGLVVECGMTAETKIVMRVVQPFCYHASGTVREWTVTLAELTPYFNLLSESASQAMTNPTMTAGGHCRDCHAVARCSTAKRASYSVITYAGEPYDISTLTSPDLAAEREILAEGIKVVKARLEAVEDDLQLRISKGDKSGGLTVQAGQGRLKWDVPAAQAIALAGNFGGDISKPGVVTPTQAIKLVPAATRPAFEGVMQSITSRPSTGMKLVKLENSRAARAFQPERK